jgi:hypothetical protein
MKWTRNLKMNRLSRVQRAYIAGYVDGEGCITLSRKKDPEARLGFCFRPHVHVANTHQKSLVMMQRWTGLGRVNHFRAEPDRNRKERWQWQIWSQQARQLLESIVPFLTIKKERAEILLDFLRRCRRRPGSNRLSKREAAFQIRTNARIKLLNHRGL